MADLALSAAVPPVGAAGTHKLALLGLAALAEGGLTLLTLPFTCLVTEHHLGIIHQQLA
jgi:hypothetical protein